MSKFAVNLSALARPLTVRHEGIFPTAAALFSRCTTNMKRARHARVNRDANDPSRADRPRIGDDEKKFFCDDRCRAEIGRVSG
jgi:hypothetical protein